MKFVTVRKGGGREGFEIYYVPYNFFKTPTYAKFVSIMSRGEGEGEMVILGVTNFTTDPKFKFPFF